MGGGEVAQLADHDIRLPGVPAQVGKELRPRIADMGFRQHNVHAAGVEQSQGGLQRGTLPIFNIRLHGANGGDWLGGGLVESGPEGQGNLLAHLAPAGPDSLRVIDAAEQHPQSGCAGVLHQQTEEAGAVGGGTGSGIISGVGEVDRLSRLHSLESSVQSLLLGVRLRLETEVVPFAPHQLRQTQGLPVRQSLGVRGHVDGGRAVLVVAPGEAHEIGAGQNPVLLFCLPERVNEAAHRLHRGGGLLPGNEQRDFHPGRRRFDAVLQGGNGHAGGVDAGFKLVRVGGALIAHKPIAVPPADTPPRPPAP